MCNDDRLFWKEIQRVKKAKSTPLATTVNTVTGSKAITDMWHKHFKDPLSPSKDISSKNGVIHELEMDKLCFSIFATTDVAECIQM